MNALEKAITRIGRKPGHPIVIAHRGSSKAAPENTATALDLAAEEEADVVEFDVRITRDGVLVVMHDARLGRTVSDMHLVSELTADEVTSFDAGKWVGKEFRGELVPLLEEAFSTLRGRAVPVVDIKDPGTLGIAAAHALVAILVEDQVDALVASTHAEVLEVMAKESPRTPRILIAVRHKTALEAIKSGKYAGCFVWWGSFSADLVAAGRNAGVFVAPWVVPNDKIAKIAATGVDAILTDEPRVALSILEKARVS